MPSSSYSSGFSSRAVISSNSNANVAIVSSLDCRAARSISSPLNRERSDQMAFEVPPLPYGYDALEPHIDEQTMRVHHDKHHQAYVDNANAALEGTALADKPVEHVLANLEALPEDKQTAVRNNAGGHANHSLFWEIMGPNGGGEPSGNLANAIEDIWGGP